MDDKVFELMTKMYSDITTKLDKMDDKISNIEQKLDSKADKGDIVRLENKLDDHSKALFDGYKQTYEEVKEVKIKLEELSSKVQTQEVEIKVIKGGKS